MPKTAEETRDVERRQAFTARCVRLANRITSLSRAGKKADVTVRAMAQLEKRGPTDADIAAVRE